MIVNDVIDRVIPNPYGVIRLPDIRRTIFRRSDKRMGKRSVYRLVNISDQLVCRFRVAQMQFDVGGRPVKFVDERRTDIKRELFSEQRDAP